MDERMIITEQWRQFESLHFIFIRISALRFCIVSWFFSFESSRKLTVSLMFLKVFFKVINVNSSFLIVNLFSDENIFGSNLLPHVEIVSTSCASHFLLNIRENGLVMKWGSWLHSFLHNFVDVSLLFSFNFLNFVEQIFVASLNFCILL